MTHAIAATFRLTAFFRGVRNEGNYNSPPLSNLGIDIVKSLPIIHIGSKHVVRRAMEMAENEYLDASKGLRWRQVAEALCERLGVQEATGRALDSLLKTLRHVGKDIPFADMIQAIETAVGGAR